jgi:hypothetical protein
MSLEEFEPLPESLNAGNVKPEEAMILKSDHDELVDLKAQRDYLKVRDDGKGWMNANATAEDVRKVEELNRKIADLEKKIFH